MSSTRLHEDTCYQKFRLMGSVDSAGYGLQTPRAECTACFPVDPALRMAGTAAAQCTDKPRVDVESELFSITRAASACPTSRYLPSAKETCGTSQPLPDCQAVPNETTRLSNPPCTLRSTGWNRWEWLCKNPQDTCLVPFDYSISSRIVVKDNHRPWVDAPINQAPALPPLNASDEMFHGPEPCQFGTQPTFTSLHWRDARTYAPYLKA